ncbi:hypothetical protein, partial [Chryseobacterium sp.]|uniref:hypothetical protein n=1 Tax=Chryseobacterium sp. TaxID=1871047 RepID=UPI00321A2358
YADVNNDYLAKYLDAEALEQFTSSWVFYNRDEEFRFAELLNRNGKIFSFLWEYSDNNLLEKIDQWKRAFRRNNIDGLSDMKFRYKDYCYSDKKVYLDIAETDCITADEAFKNYSAFNVARNLTQFIVDENKSVEDLDLHFLDTVDPLTRFEKCIRMIDYEWLSAIILNGYHHRGDFIKVFIHKKKEHILPEQNRLKYDVFENIYVANSLCWK